MDPELESLRATLMEVTALLDLSDDDPPDLISLKGNLVELIALKESELLEERKKIALIAVESAMSGNVMSNQSEPDDNAEHERPQLLSEKILQLPGSAPHFPSGSHCSLPGWTSRGYFINQNAIIAEVIEGSTFESLCPRVRVFLVNPTRLSQVPCDQFLITGVCSGGLLCRFSHGIEASVDELRAWDEPDPNAYLEEGHLCLALNKSGNGQSVWHHARIQHTDFDSETCIVEWISTASGQHSRLSRSQSYSELDSHTISLPLVCVHPIRDEPQRLGSTNSWSSSPWSSSGDDLTDDLHNSIVNENTVDPSEIAQDADAFSPDSLPESVPHSTSDEPLGAWEAHTRGIGTRLLSRMGYTGTGGLGRHGMGRRLPVSMDSRLHQVVVDDVGFSHPSVDRLVALRSDPSSIRKKRHKARGSNSSTLDKSQSEGRIRQATEGRKGSVFDFLNGTVFGQSKPEGALVFSRVTIDPKNASSKSTREVNIKLYDFQRKIAKVRDEISKTEDSLRRNEMCDRRVATIARRRLSVLRSSLLSLKKSEKDLSIKSAKQKSVDQLRVF